MATIQIQAVPENDLTIFTVEGDLSADEIIDYSSEYYNSRPTKFVLWDVTNGSVENISSNDFRRIATEIKKHAHKRSGGRTAMVFKSDTGYGLSRMYQAYADIEDIPIEYRAFHSFDDAMNWLKE